MKRLFVLFLIVTSQSFLEAKRVYVNMVADLFHAGHVNFLRQAAELGDELIVGIVHDDYLKAYKRIPVISLPHRVKVVSACVYVNEVIDGTPVIIDRAFMEEHNIDLIAHGNDFTEEKMKYYFPYAYEIGAVFLVPYTPGISTTDIIRSIKERTDLDIVKSPFEKEYAIDDWL